MEHLENKMLKMIPLTVVWDECLDVLEACFWLAAVMMVIGDVEPLVCWDQLTDALNVRTTLLV